jgi:hypothetical protein
LYDALYAKGKEIGWTTTRKATVSGGLTSIEEKEEESAADMEPTHTD